VTKCGRSSRVYRRRGRGISGRVQVHTCRVFAFVRARWLLAVNLPANYRESESPYRLASLRVASPRLTSSRLASPHLASPCLALPRRARCNSASNARTDFRPRARKSGSPSGIAGGGGGKDLRVLLHPTSSEPLSFSLSLSLSLSLSQAFISRTKDRETSANVINIMEFSYYVKHESDPFYAGRTCDSHVFCVTRV